MLRLTPLFLLLASCGNNDQQPGPGAVSIDETKAVADAAAMLDERRPSQQPAATADPP